MDVGGLLEETYGRITQIVERALDGADDATLLWRPDPDANSIAWLVWHLTRVQDDHIAEVADRAQVWEEGAWAPRFGLTEGTMETGNGHTSEQVGALRPDSLDTLRDYHLEVAERTVGFLRTLTSDTLDTVIDTSYDPPVTMGVRLVSVISDNIQHAGQARYVRGMYDRTQA